MDRIWHRKSRRSLAVVAGMKKLNDHAEPTKVEGLKNIKKGTDLTHVFSMTITLLCYLDFVVQSILINQCTH